MSFTEKKNALFSEANALRFRTFFGFQGAELQYAHTSWWSSPPPPCEESKYIPSKPATQVVKKLCLFVKWIDKTVFIKMDVIPGFFLHE